MPRAYSNGYLLLMLQLKALELGRTPTADEINADHAMPSSSCYKEHFTSLHEAASLANIPPRSRGEVIVRTPRSNYYSDEQLLALLKTKAEKLGYTPSAKEITADPAMPNANTYKKRFDNLSNAAKKAGLQPRVRGQVVRRYSDHPHKLTREQLIAQFQAKAKVLGRPPKMREIRRDPKMASEPTYRKYFGSYPDLLTAMGY